MALSMLLVKKKKKKKGPGGGHFIGIILFRSGCFNSVGGREIEEYELVC